MASSSGPEDTDYSHLKDKIVKVIVTNKNNPYLFDTFINHLDSLGLIEIQIVEDHHNLNLEDDADIVNEAESTMQIFKKYIDQFDEEKIDKVKLEKTINELYQEALTVE